LINNNRQAGRRRGRGGQRQGGGNPNSGNRIDNRARGNASQLLEKYKALAADAQRQGDRVNAEYYLQFADHYFRVLAESRSRFEEQNQNQRRGREDAFDDEDEGFEEDGNDAAAEAEQPRRQHQPREDRGQDGQREPREYRGRDRQERGDREPREDRGNRVQGGDSGYVNGNARPAHDGDEDTAGEAPAERAAPRRGRPRRDARPVESPAESNEGETFDAALLPPSLGIGVGDEGEPAPAPKPRRGRPRRPAAEADAAE